MSTIDRVRRQLVAKPRRWLVTGSAGFIGSHLVETLLALDQTVVGLDNFATGHRHNITNVEANVTAAQRAGHHFIEGDICDLDTCRTACRAVDVVAHQAAPGSGSTV